MERFAGRMQVTSSSASLRCIGLHGNARLPAEGGAGGRAAQPVDEARLASAVRVELPEHLVQQLCRRIACSSKTRKLMVKTRAFMKAWITVWV